MPSAAQLPGREPVVGGRLLRRYRSAWLRPDVVAGLTVGAMLVPQSMAYAELAGVPAATGLYASLLAPVAYALVGTSRHLGTGPEPGTALLAATGVGAIVGADGGPDRYLALMAALALMVSLIAGVGWLLRLGIVAQLLSRPVLVGYITGVGLVLLSSQLQAFTGVPVAADGFVPRVLEFGRNAGQLRGSTTLLATAALVTVLAARRWMPRLPGALLAVTLTTITTWTLGLAARGEPTIGVVPDGLPLAAVPAIDLGDLRALLPVALGVALVGYSDNVLTARAVGSRMGYRIDPDQELAGLAAANLGAGVLQGMPVSSSASRSVVAATSGGVTSLVGGVAAAVVATTLLVAGDVVAAVPRAALAAVIVAAAVSIVDLEGLADLWRISRIEWALAVVTSLTVVLVDVLAGVLVAVALSLGVALLRMARPADAVLGVHDDVDGWIPLDDDPRSRTLPGLLVYRFDAPLFFLNVERFRSRLLAFLDRNPGRETWVVLDFEAVGDVDASAIDGLRDLVAQLDTDGVEVVAVARTNRRAQDRLRRGGLLTPDGAIRTYPSIERAVAAFRRSADRSRTP